MKSKEYIEWFNKNKTKELYREILKEYFPDYKKCNDCNDVIYYYDSSFGNVKGQLELKGKSFKSTKMVYKIHKLSVCEDCLTKKYPEYESKNKSKVFNQMNYLTEYAFGITHEDATKWIKEKYAITEKNLIKKWGEELGKLKWMQYCEKQSKTNTFDYKREKYGWTEDEFKEYNKSRSVTIENLVRRHGEEEGLIIWKRHCDKQKYTTSVQYFISKHGHQKGIEIYENFCKKRLFGAGYSKVSKMLFDSLSKYFEGYEVFYAENEWYSYDNQSKKFYLLDFYVKELNIAVEFQGDMWHANPCKYKPTDKPFPFQKNYTAQDIWDKDKNKNDFLRTKLDKLVIIWESDFYSDGIEKTVQKILNEINHESKI